MTKKNDDIELTIRASRGEGGDIKLSISAMNTKKSFETPEEHLQDTFEETNFKSVGFTPTLANKPWLDAKPGETWVLYAKNNYRDIYMWMVATTSECGHQFVVSPPNPNDSCNMYYMKTSPSILKSIRLDDFNV